MGFRNRAYQKEVLGGLPGIAIVGTSGSLLRRVPRESTGGCRHRASRTSIACPATLLQFMLVAYPEHPAAGYQQEDCVACGSISDNAVTIWVMLQCERDRPPIPLQNPVCKTKGLPRSLSGLFEVSGNMSLLGIRDRDIGNG